jgi:DSF synthase
VNREFFEIFREYETITVRYDDKHKALWCYYSPTVRPCFSLKMLGELQQWQKSIIRYFESRTSSTEAPIHYLVLHSQVPGVFSLGGDLALFSRLIREKNREELLDYGIKCIETLYLNSINLNLPLTTISLVEGNALGGGFECALSSNVMIATKNAIMGFPEIRFNLFPGMGAYSFIARTCGTGIADRMLASGATYNAEELYEMGIVHQLAEAGDGIPSVEKYMRLHRQTNNGFRALQQVRQCYNPIDYNELLSITKIWADTAVQLEEKDLRLIDRLVKAQALKMTKQHDKSLLRTKQDRRFSKNGISFPLADWSGNTIIYDRRKNSDRRLFHYDERLITNINERFVRVRDTETVQH